RLDDFLVGTELDLVRSEEGRNVSLGDVALEDLLLDEAVTAGDGARNDRQVRDAGNGYARAGELALLTVVTVRRVGRPVGAEDTRVAEDAVIAALFPAGFERLRRSRQGKK